MWPLHLCAAGLHGQVHSPRQRSSTEHNDLPQMTQNHSCLTPLLPRWPGSEDALLEAHSCRTGKGQSSQCTWSGSHGCTFKHMFSNPQNKPEWIIWKLFYNRAVNEKIILWKVAPLEILCFTVHQLLPSPHFLSGPWSWIVVHPAVMIPTGAPGGCVLVNSLYSEAGFIFLVGCTCLVWT